MVVYDVPTKIVDKEISPQHTIADLNLWHFIYCFFQSGKAFTVEGNKDTHTRTATHNHTRTHARTHTRMGPLKSLLLDKSVIECGSEIAFSGFLVNMNFTHNSFQLLKTK